MADVQLTAEEVYMFIAKNGGKIANSELVKHFKWYLNKPEQQAEARTKFKDTVNMVASMKVIDGVKYLILKKDVDITPDKSGVSHNGNQSEIFKEPKPKRTKEYENGTSDSHSFPCVTASPPSSSQLSVPLHHGNIPVISYSKGPWSPDLPIGETPQPPPRRKNSTRGKENSDVKIGTKTTNEVREDHTKQSEVVSTGIVKERAQKLNRMTSEIDLSQKTSNGSSSNRRSRLEKSCDDDTSSVSALDPRRKEWNLMATRADYHGLLKLLREESKLANCKDFNSYTALHWAAKHGNLDIIKLMAGTHGVNTNARTNGGYTPLHLAAIFDREEIMEVLINTYGADPTLRDYSGKRPVQYLPCNQAQRFRTLFPLADMNGNAYARKFDKELTFHRIGSLNSKMKKSSIITTRGKALTRMKSWGSADNIQDRNLMPPPKFFPKKKKSKLRNSFGAGDVHKIRFGESDSDSGAT